MEEFRDIEGFEGYYQVSNLGRVKSLERVTIGSNGGKYPTKEKILKGSNHNGYRIIHLSKENKESMSLVHRLVAQAFILNLDNKLEINHINGIKNDNRVENLEWSTPSENLKHAYSIGLRNCKGINNTRAKLTNENVSEIRRLLRTGKYSQRVIASKFGVAKQSIGNIKTGYTWSHVQ